MGRLVIAHHKSYHPYRRDNIEKVRRDEEEAQLKEAKEEGRLMLADSEARIDRLREKAGASSRSRKGKGKEKEEDMDLMPPPALPASGHINFFEDLEQNAITTAVRASRSKKDEVTEDDKGVRLAPTQKDLNPWYTEKRKDSNDSDQTDDKDKRRRDRDIARKSAHDPLTSITHQLSSRPSSSSSQSSSSRGSSSSAANPHQARLSRESSERERALALIRKRRREMEGSETPSTVCESEGYGDVYNRQDVEAAHRGRGDYRRRGWDEDQHRHRGRDYERGRGERRRSWGR
jgi:hypothetical protein